MEKVEHYMNELGLMKYTELPLIKKISLKTKVPSTILVLICSIICLCLVFTPYVSNVLTTIIAFGIPAFQTFKAMKTVDKADDDAILTYWIVFSTFYSFDRIFRSFLELSGWYTLIRFVILVVMFYSQRFGSKLLYARIIRPLFERYGDAFDSYVKPLEERARRVSSYLKNQQTEYARAREMQKEYNVRSGEDNDNKEKTE